MHSYSRRLGRAAAALAATAIGLTACFGGTTDKIQAALNDAIGNLDLQSSSWQATLTSLEQQLSTDGSNLVTQVQSLLAASIQQAGGETRCSIDFIGTEVRGQLQNFLNTYLHKPLNPPQPHVCSTNPTGDVQLAQVHSGQVHELDVSGYDLSLSQGFGMSVVDAAGHATPIDARYLAAPSAYLVTLNLNSANGFQIPTGTQQIAFTDNGATVGTTNVEAVPVAPPPPPAVLLRNPAVRFQTHDDDKDDDTYLTVTLENKGGQQVASWRQTSKDQWPNNSLRSVSLTPASFPITDVQPGKLVICIAPNGNDTWRFDYTLTATISTGGVYTVAQAAQQLTQDNRCLTKVVS